MHSTIFAGNSNSSYDGYSDIAPPPPLLPSLPLYLRFVLSQQTHLSTLTTQQQEENIIYLDHGFQLALFLHSDNSSNYSHNHNQDKHKHNDGDGDNQQPLSQNTTVIDSDTTTTTTTTPTTAHTPLSDTTKPPELRSKERIDNDNSMFSGFFQHTTAQPSTTFHHDGNIANNKGCQSTVLEMTLTLGGHQDDDDEGAKEYYGSMVHAIHLFEIDLDGDRLYISKAVYGHDLTRHGVSFLVNMDDVVKTDLCTLGILLSSDSLELLVPPDVIDQSVADPFGRSLLIRFLLDTHSADVAYSPSTSPSSIATSPHPTHSGLKGQSPRSQQNTITHAHSAIMHQYPAFNRLIRHFPRPNDNPKIHKLIDIDPQAMRLLINFLYLNQIEGPGYTGIVDWRPIFQLAHRFKIPRLVELSLSELCKEMRVETVLPTLFGWAYQHPDYEDRLLELLLLHLRDVFWPTLKESLEPYRGHREFERVCGKLEAMKMMAKQRHQRYCVMPE